MRRASGGGGGSGGSPQSLRMQQRRQLGLSPAHVPGCLALCIAAPLQSRQGRGGRPSGPRRCPLGLAQRQAAVCRTFRECASGLQAPPTMPPPAAATWRSTGLASSGCLIPSSRSRLACTVIMALSHRPQPGMPPLGRGPSLAALALALAAFLPASTGSTDRQMIDAEHRVMAFSYLWWGRRSPRSPARRSAARSCHPAWTTNPVQVRQPRARWRVQTLEPRGKLSGSGIRLHPPCLHAAAGRSVGGRLALARPATQQRKQARKKAAHPPSLQVLPHWHEHVNKQHPQVGRRFEPPGELHSPFYPVRGPYSSADPELLADQFREMKAAGEPRPAGGAALVCMHLQTRQACVCDWPHLSSSHAGECNPLCTSATPPCRHRRGGGQLVGARLAQRHP